MGPRHLHFQSNVHFYTEDKGRMCWKTRAQIFSTLTLWHLTQGTPVMQCDAHDAECQVKVTAFNSLPYTDLI